MGLCESESETKNKEETENPILNIEHNKNIISSLKSLCQIRIKEKERFIYGNGFFLNIFNKKYLITNNHIISQNTINNDIDIEIHNKTIIKLILKNRAIKYYPEPKDITMIEINTNDVIYNDIEFLDYDINFINNGYDIYKNKNIFIIQCKFGENAKCFNGKVININNYEFQYNISNNYSLSGCPILYIDNNNLIKVIGINKGQDLYKNYNHGIFIGEIIKQQNINKDSNDNNYITAEIDIKDDEINEEIRIINSYEEFERCLGNKDFEKEKMNEELIKTFEIKLNNASIPFTYLYKFPKKGIYTIKYSFNKIFNNFNHIFSECVNIISIDLSKFNSEKITNMSYAFYKCKSLSKINFSNINTLNVNDMSYLFCRCKSLINIDISNFNTSKVNNMKDMFSWCESLIEINLSNFNTKNVTDMYGMFCGCKSLVNLDLANFNTNNVTDMNLMFCGCRNLEIINLENFRTDNVTDMIDMFSGCQKLKKENIITHDNKIKNVKIIKALNKM